MIDAWLSVAQGKSPNDIDTFFRFVAAWIAFNATYAARARDDDLEGYLFGRYRDSRELWEKHKMLMNKRECYTSAVLTVTEKRVRDSRKDWVAGERAGEVQERRVDGEYNTMHNQSDFKALMNAVYQIRCNLFHGGKLPYNPRDKKLVAAALEIVMGLLDPTVAVSQRSERSVRRR